MNKKLFYLLGICVIMGGCSLIPEYKQPEAPVPQIWPGGPAYEETGARQDTPFAADLRWREFFNDESLRQVINMALQNNRDLKVAALNVERARALYRIQRDDLLPDVAAGGSYYKERVPADLSYTGHSMHAEQYQVGLGVSSWEIDFFGRIRSLEKRVLEEFFATEQARRSAQIVLVSEVATNYITLAGDRENLQLAQSTLQSQQDTYHLIQRRFEVGLAPELDLRQVQTRVDSARVDVARFTELTARDQNALNLLVGSPVPADLLPDTLGSIIPLADVSPGMSSAVLLQRPDILQTENLLKAANANIGAARAALFPSISLTTSIGLASADLSDLFTSDQGTWTFVPGVSIPIFDSGLKSAVKVSEVERQIALVQYERAIQSAFREVADALAKKGTIGDQMAAQQSLVEANEATYRLSTMRYEKGIDTYLSVLDAQRSLYAARQGLIGVRLDRFGNQIQIYAVLGGGGDVPEQDGEGDAS
ncbi:MAG: efflux transporter outer membrane subunit [Desulfobacterales bacterium]|nr:efflux transporter outer membrane subunit [Desulfobacterales bacterium]MDD4394045.1 efflux transporter outer membrane subunit [Desulfobacterales bacterium]